MRLTLTARVGFVIVLSVSVAWIGSLALFYESEAHSGDAGRPLPSQVQALTQLLEKATPAERELLLRAVSSQSFKARLEDGTRLRKAQTPRRTPPAIARAVDTSLAAIGGRSSQALFVDASGEPWRFVNLLPASPALVEVRVALATGETLVVEARGAVTNLLGLPVGFVAGLLGSVTGLAALLVMLKMVRPLTQLARSVDTIDLSGTPVMLAESSSGAPEIRALLGAFNRLQQRLDLLLRARMAMLGGISHDVRTFATRLRLRVDNIPDITERERASADLSDMVRLLDDALLASRAGASELAEELVDFGLLVRGEARDRWTEGAEVALRIDSREPPIWVLGDRVALRRIVANLLDNALKYGDCARVSVGSDARSVTLTVDDEGPGIPVECREAILEPFVRLEESRNRGTGGAGLGLAIVRNLVDAHRGTMSISDSPSGGARLAVSLPLFTPG